MGIVHCPHCRLAVHETPELAGLTVECPNCHRPFQMPVPQAVAAVPVYQPAEEVRTPYVSSYRRERGPQNSPGVAAVLSFLFIGLGQIYNGQFGKAILLMLVWLFFAGATIVFFPAGILLVVFWLYGMMDAFVGAETYNNRRR